jgi:hypothetical protein
VVGWSRAKKRIKSKQESKKMLAGLLTLRRNIKRGYQASAARTAAQFLSETPLKPIFRKFKGIAWQRNAAIRNWGKPEMISVPYTGASSFEEVVKKLRLSPTDYESSIQLKEWVRKKQGSEIRAIKSARLTTSF